MMRKKIFAVTASLLLVLMLCVPVTTQAYSFFSNPCSQAGSDESAACSGTGKSGSNPVVETLNKTTTLIAIAAGAAAVILLVIAGFMFVTSGGDASKVESAKKTVIYTVVGLIVIVLARFIIGFVISNVYK